MRELESLLNKVTERSEISQILLCECRKMKALRDSYEVGSVKHKEYADILHGLLMAANIVVNR